MVTMFVSKGTFLYELLKSILYFKESRKWGFVMKKTAIILMLLTILSTIIGFIRDLVLSYFYGATYITDAYLISLTIPQTLVAFIGAIIASIYIPVYSDVEHKESIEQAEKFTNNLVNYLLLLCMIIVLCVLLATPLFVKIFAMGFTGETFKLTVRFTRISIFSIFLSCLIFLYSSYLQIKNKFFITGIINIPLNIVVILFIVLSVKYNIYYLVIGSVVGAILQLMIIIPFLKKSGYKYRFVFDTKDKYIKKMVSLSIPVIFGVSIYQLNILIDKTIASQIVTGGISVLSYASKVNAMVFGVFAVPIATALYPMISKMGAEKNMIKLKDTVLKALIIIMILVIPATVGSMVLADPIIRLLFERGAFDSKTISMTATVLLFYSIGMLGVSLREILYRAFYSIQDTKTPLFNAAIAMVLNIILSIVLSRFIGIGGIALATSISSIVGAFLLLIKLRSKVFFFSLKGLFIPFLKITLSSIAMGFIAKIIYKILIVKLYLFPTVFFTILISIVTYIILIKKMKVQEFNELFLIFKNKINKFNRNGL